MEARTTSALLYLDARLRVVRRLPRAQQPVARGRAGRDARHHRAERRRQDHHDGRDHRQDAARRGRRVISTARSISPSSTRRRSPSSASAANSRSRPCSRCTPSRTICASRSRASAARAGRWCGARPRPSRRASTRSSTPSGSARCARASPGSLSHGQKQWLEIGMLLAQDPKLLLVDEPVAGMTDAETHQTAELLKEINAGQDRGGGRARHDLRARARRQGDVPARRLGAGRRLDRSGVAERARGRSVSGTVALIMLERRTRSICTTARRRRCAASRCRPSPARSPACSAATASARPACSMR